MSTQAKKLVERVEKERNGATIMLGRAVKSWPSTHTILGAEPQLKVAFIQEVVAIFAKLGARTTTIPTETAWFHGDDVPSGAEEIARLLLRKRLPFTDEALAEIFEQIAGMEFITFAPALEHLLREIEKRAGTDPLRPRLRKALSRVADGLLVKHWKRADAENWGLPRAADRKLAARIERMLAGSLDLN